MTIKFKSYIYIIFLFSLLTTAVPTTTKAQNVTSYEQAVKKADMLFSSGKLMDAKAYYQIALKYKPDEPYVKKKINDIINRLSSQMDKEDEYYDIIDKADLYFEENALNKALDFYQKALNIIPDDKYAKEKIQEIHAIKTNEKEKLAQFQKYIKEGTVLLSKNEFDKAIGLFQKAKKLFPANSTPAEKINTAKQLKKDYFNKQKKFDELVTEAGRYLLINKFSDALKLYQEAQKLFPENREIAAKITELTPKAKNQLEYETLVEEADNLYINKNYAAAKNRYVKASKLWPENNYAADMINRINEQLADQMKDLEKNYLMAVKSGDSLFNNKDYEAAKAQYNLALTLKPDEQYPQNQLDAIGNIYAERKAEMQKQYASIVSKGDSLLNALQLDEAKKQYEIAISIRPDDNYPKNKLKEIDKKAQEIAERQKLKIQYDAIIAEADKLYKNGQYELAIAKYKEAQVLDAISDYPQARIKEIQQLLADAQKAKQINENYNKQIILANRLKQEGKLNEARKAYQAASEIKPAEKLPAEQIAEIDKLIFAQQQEAEINRKYEASMKSADSLMNLKLWEDAIGLYRYAATLKPQETTPKLKITKIETIKANIIKEAQKKKAYDNFVKKADSLLKNEQYELAIVQYQKALNLKPNEKHPSDKIKQINDKLKEIAAQRERKYQESLTKADNFYEQGNFRDALVNYEIAASIKPENTHCKQRINECNAVIEEMNKKREAEYNLAIADADKLYAAKIYDKAIKNYRKAQKIIPSKTYPQEMIDKITKFIDENSIVDVIKKPMVIKKGETQKLSFEPIPINVRKYNYFLLRAKGTGKLLFTYGSINGKNGGFVVNLQNDGKINDYLIRVGNQYKWFSEDNDWITILPQNNDVKIELLRISKSN